MKVFLNGREIKNKFILYKNGATQIEIDKLGVRELGKYTQKIMNKVNEVIIEEDNNKVTVTVDRELFSKLTFYRKEIL